MDAVVKVKARGKQAFGGVPSNTFASHSRAFHMDLASRLIPRSQGLVDVRPASMLGRDLDKKGLPQTWGPIALGP